MGACTRAVQRFSFWGLGWDRQSSGGRGGLGVFPETHQGREREIERERDTQELA